MSEVLYLKATDRESLIAALEAAGMWDKNGFKKRYQGDELFERDKWTEPTGKMIDSPFGKIAERVAIPGYFADMTLFGEVPLELEAIRIYPDDPPYQPGGWESPKVVREKAAARAAAEVLKIEG